MEQQRRNFTKSILKPGAARQAREVVNLAVRESALSARPRIVQPLDYENFLVKNKTVLENDAFRELVLFPPDDLTLNVVPRQLRTTYNSVSAETFNEANSLFTQECLKSYLNDWQTVDFKSSRFDCDFATAAVEANIDEPVADLIYECDFENSEEVASSPGSPSKRKERIIKDGFLYGPYVSSDQNLGGLRSMKKRYCLLRQDVDGSYRLDFYKDKSTKGGLKATVYLDVCQELTQQHWKKGRQILKLTQPQAENVTIRGRGSSPNGEVSSQLYHVLSFETDLDCAAWKSHIKDCLEKLLAAAKKSKAEDSLSVSSGQTVETASVTTDNSLDRIKNSDIVKYQNETEQSVAFTRQQNRRNPFADYPDIYLERTLVSRRHKHTQAATEVEPFKESLGFRFLVTCNAQNLKLPVSASPRGIICEQVEPFFVTLFLMDPVNGCKLSEDFYCDLNPASLMEDLQPESAYCNGHVPNGHAISKEPSSNDVTSTDQRHLDQKWLMTPTRKAIFSVTRPHSEVFLVVRIEKVLQGSVSSGQEPYVKPDLKSTAKLQKSLKSYCQKLGRYRMAFAWAAKPVFQPLIGLNANNSNALDEMTLYRQDAERLSDAELLKLIQESRKSDKSAKIPTIGGSISVAVDISVKAERIPYCLTPSYILLEPFSVSTAEAPPVLEVQCFNQNSDRDAVPYTSLTHHLYVYPVSLKFDGQKSFTKARNIVCKVQFMDSDNNGSVPLMCIYAKRDGTSTEPMTDTMFCAVTHHETSPEFYQEIKLLLPVNVHKKHHLLLTFYHVSVDSVVSSKKHQQLESIVGYAWAPLMKEQSDKSLRLAIEDELNLRVSATLPSGYLEISTSALEREDCSSEAKWLDGGKPLLRLNCRLWSTALTRDVHIQSFFSYCQRMIMQNTPGDIATEKVQLANGNASTTEVGLQELVRLVKTLHKADLNAVINFLPVILNQLMMLFAAIESEDVSVNVVSTLVHIVDQIDVKQKGDLLKSYVKYVFVPPSDISNRSMHEGLIKALTAALRPAKLEDAICAKMLQHMWLFIEILMKSMAHKLLSTERIKMSRVERFSSDFQYRVETFLQTLVTYVCTKYKELPDETRAANLSLALFLKGCINLLNRGFVLQQIQMYVTKIDLTNSKTLGEYKMDFLDQICRHEHFLPLNMPVLCSKSGAVRRKSSGDAECECHICSKPAAATSSATATTSGPADSPVAPSENGVTPDGAETSSGSNTPTSMMDPRRMSQTEGSLTMSIWQRLLNIGAGMLFSPHQASSSMSSGISPEIMGHCGHRSGAANDTTHELWLTDEFCRHHFLVGILLQLLNWSMSENKDIRTRCILLLRNLIAKHSFDKRYSSNSMQMRISTLYFPLLSVVVEHVEDLSMPAVTPSPSECSRHEAETIKGKTSNAGGLLGASERVVVPLRRGFAVTLNSSPTRSAASLRQGDSANVQLRNAVNLVPSGSAELNSNQPISASENNQNPTLKMIDATDGAQPLPTRRQHAKTGSTVATTLGHALPFLVYTGIEGHELRELVLCVMYLLKHAPLDQLNNWLKTCNEQHLLKFLNLLQLSRDLFKYKGKRTIIAEIEDGTAGSRRSSRVFNSLPSSLSLKKVFAVTPEMSSPQAEIEPNLFTVLEANLSQEISLIVLDTLSAFCSQFQGHLETPKRDHLVLDKVLELFLSFLDPHFSDVCIFNALASLRQLLKNLSTILFRTNTTYCATICEKLLRCLNSGIDEVQKEACATLYLLMKQNYESTGRRNFSRMNVQVTISLSQLLGDVVGFNNAQFHQALALLGSFVNADRSVQYTGFAQEAKELVKKQRTVLMATAQLRDHSDDPEMLADLQRRLADSYAGTPVLRQTWLESLAKHHQRFRNFSEAAYCQLHIAALIAECLKRKGFGGLFRGGCQIFRPVSENFLKEEIGQKDESSVRDVPYTEETYVQSIELAADLLLEARRYELLGFLYRTVVPFYEEKRRYDELSRIYKRLQEASDDIVELNRSGRRRLGTYFRVAFYGQYIFESEDGKDYVYKEPEITSLAEISGRLRSLYAEKYGIENVKLITDSVPVNTKDLDERIGYIQITHVVQVFEPEEAARRVSEYERNTCVQKFVFETPFTKDGRAHAQNVGDQWKRKTFITTIHSLPFIVKRVPIFSKRIQEMDPLEVACDEMTLRAQELLEIISSENIDLKKLQLKLQGAIQVTVNSGSVAYAEAFTEPSRSAAYGTERMNSFKECFKQFLLTCSEALHANRNLVQTCQFEYHEALVENFRKLVERLNEIFGEDMLADREQSITRRSSSVQVFNVISGLTVASSNA